jgi:hypothetical protein
MRTHPVHEPRPVSRRSRRSGRLICHRRHTLSTHGAPLPVGSPVQVNDNTRPGSCPRPHASHCFCGGVPRSRRILSRVGSSVAWVLGRVGSSARWILGALDPRSRWILRLARHARCCSHSSPGPPAPQGQVLLTTSLPASCRPSFRMTAARLCQRRRRRTSAVVCHPHFGRTTAH